MSRAPDPFGTRSRGLMAATARGPSVEGLNDQATERAEQCLAPLGTPSGASVWIRGPRGQWLALTWLKEHGGVWQSCTRQYDPSALGALGWRATLRAEPPTGLSTACSASPGGGVEPDTRHWLYHPESRRWVVLAWHDIMGGRWFDPISSYSPDRLTNDEWIYWGPADPPSSEASATKTLPGTLKILNRTGSPHDTRFEVLGEDGNWHRLTHVQAMSISLDATKSETLLNAVTLTILCPQLDLQAAPPHVSWRRADQFAPAPAVAAPGAPEPEQ